MEAPAGSRQGHREPRLSGEGGPKPALTRSRASKAKELRRATFAQRGRLACQPSSGVIPSHSRHATKSVSLNMRNGGRRSSESICHKQFLTSETSNVELQGI